MRAISSTGLSQDTKKLKRREHMIIAIPVLSDDGINSLISEHFGHAPYFAFILIENGQIKSVEIEENPHQEHGPGVIPNYVKSHGANLIIVRGIGQRAVDFFEKLGIKVIRGAEGSIASIVNQYLAGKLRDSNYTVTRKFH